MSTISTTDILFATIMRGGRALLTTRLTGVDSFSALLSKLRIQISALASTGPVSTSMMKVNVRNHTQGWTASQAVILR